MNVNNQDNLSDNFNSYKERLTSFSNNFEIGTIVFLFRKSLVLFLFFCCNFLFPPQTNDPRPRGRNPRPRYAAYPQRRSHRHVPRTAATGRMKGLCVLLKKIQQSRKCDVTLNKFVYLIWLVICQKK